jgi:hypothetical protein
MGLRERTMEMARSRKGAGGPVVAAAGPFKFPKLRGLGDDRAPGSAVRWGSWPPAPQVSEACVPGGVYACASTRDAPCRGVVPSVAAKPATRFDGIGESSATFLHATHRRCEGLVCFRRRACLASRDELRSCVDQSWIGYAVGSQTPRSWSDRHRASGSPDGVQNAGHRETATDN